MKGCHEHDLQKTDKQYFPAPIFYRIVNEHSASFLETLEEATREVNYEVDDYEEEFV